MFFSTNKINKMKKIKLFFIGIPILIIFLLVTWTFLAEQPTTIGFDQDRIFIDEKGIPYYDFRSISGEYIGIQRNPIIIYRVADDYFQDFKKTDDEISKKFFLNNANWIIENTVKNDNYSIYHHSFPYPTYNLPVGWTDAMAQGRMINIMIKAYKLTNEEKYLTEAKLLSNGFFVDVSDGGLTHKTTNNGWWYEHRAHKDGIKPRILNAHMSTLLDIYSYYQYTNDTDSKFLFDKGIIALRNDIADYDFFGYTYYNALKKPSTYNYQKIHIDKTKLLYDITGEKIFLEYHNKWKSCDEVCHFILKKVDQWIFSTFRNINLKN